MGTVFNPRRMRIMEVRAFEPDRESAPAAEGSEADEFLAQWSRGRPGSTAVS